MKKKYLLLTLISLFTLSSCSNKEEILTEKEEISMSTFNTNLKTSIKNMVNQNNLKLNASLDFDTSFFLREVKSYYIDDTFINLDETKGSKGVELLGDTFFDISLNNLSLYSEISGLNKDKVSDLNLYTTFLGDIGLTFDTSFNDDYINYLSETDYIDEDNEKETLDISHNNILELLTYLPDIDINENEVAFQTYLNEGILYADFDDSHFVNLINQYLSYTLDSDHPFESSFYKSSSLINGDNELINADLESINSYIDQIFPIDGEPSYGIITDQCSYYQNNKYTYLDLSFDQEHFPLVSFILSMLIGPKVSEEYMDLFNSIMDYLSLSIQESSLNAFNIELAFNDTGLHSLDLDIDFNFSEDKKVEIYRYEDTINYEVTQTLLSDLNFKIKANVISEYPKKLNVTLPNLKKHDYEEL